MEKIKENPIMEALKNAESVASEFNHSNSMIVLNCLIGSLRCGKDTELAAMCKAYAIECIKWIADLEKNNGCEGV